ncbi:mediator complex subunit med18 [Cystoisospora suis]|uniref:Mediator of RNA polymerase II transcription subunit 18 n=1 Tax=Cystoisospora suis TaxID=483139 RepID=A0A2C6KXJ7_9APIC|nr:mediator complex subunit med18 [Cystoisospora suis]
MSSSSSSFLSSCNSPSSSLRSHPPRMTSLFADWEEGEEEDLAAEACALFLQSHKPSEKGTRGGPGGGEEESGRHSSSGVYNEFSLQGLLLSSEDREEDEKKLRMLHETAVCFSDACEEYEWIDMKFFKDASSTTKSLDMRSASSASKEISVRMYTSPSFMKDTCAVRLKDEGNMLKKAASKRQCNVTRIAEMVASPGILHILQTIGFRQVSEVYVKGKMYFSRFASNQSATFIIQKHFLDREHREPVMIRNRLNGRTMESWLVEAKARCKDDAIAAAATDQFLASYATNFKPLVNLRKVEDRALMEAERELHNERAMMHF